MMDQDPPLEPDRLWEPPKRDNLHFSAGPAKGSAPPSPLAIVKVLGSSVLVLMLTLFALVHFYGKSNQQQLVNHLLLSPSIWQQLSFVEENNALGKSVTYFTDRVWLRPSLVGSQEAIQLTVEEYQDLYKLIQSDAALRIVTQGLEKRFDDPSMVIALNLMVRPQERSGSAGSSRVFQTVEFLLEGDYYRVSLKEQGQEQAWKYFKHDSKLNDTLLRLIDEARTSKK